MDSITGAWSIQNGNQSAFTIDGEWMTENGNQVTFDLNGQSWSGFYEVTEKTKNKIRAALILDANGNGILDESDLVFGKVLVGKEDYNNLPETASGSFSLSPNNGKIEFFLNDDFIGKGTIYSPADFL